MPVIPGYGLLNQGAPWQTTQGTTLNTAATATISPQAPTAQDFQLPGQPGGLQWYQGMSLECEAIGTYASGGTTSNLTIFLAAGVSGTLGTTLLTSGALTLGTGTVTGLRWRFKAQIDVVTLTTAAATFLAITGDLFMQTAVNPATIVGAAVNVNTVGMALATVNGSVLSPYTAATCLGMRATLSAAFGSVQCDRFKIKQIG